MCFPIQCLKSLLSAGTGLTLIASLVSLGFGITLLYQSNHLHEALYVDKVQLYKNIIEYSLIGFGVVLFFIGLFGLIGSKKKSVCCLFIFQLGAIVFTVAFVAFGLVSQQLSVQILNGKCSDISWSKDISNLSIQTELTFCRPGGCKCYIDPQNFHNKAALIATEYDPNDKTLPTQFQQCSQYTSDLDAPAAFLDAAEGLFKCSGWCVSSPIYMFSDVNDGNTGTSNSCFTEVKDFFETNGKILAYVFYGIGGFLALLVFLAFCLCCHPKRAQRAKTNYYSRMNYYDD